jgi:DNA polymerase Ligase (LigD)
MPRFALLIHDSPRGLHYDFLLEAGEVLKTWALPRVPAAGDEIECEALPDHRLVYLDYEGPVSGNRGTVTRYDSGSFQVVLWTDGEVVVEVAGEKLAGRIELRRMPGQTRRWQLSLCH